MWPHKDYPPIDIGINYAALPVNKPRCPVNTYHRDGQTRFDGNGGSLMDAGQKSQLIDNLVSALNAVPRFIQVRQIGHFYKADPDYGCRVAERLGIKSAEIIGKVT